MKKQKNNKRIIIGITGILGSGKSTVAKIFQKNGAKVIDLDKLAHQYLKKESPTYAKLVKFFGRGILGKDKKIKRQKLAELAFHNRKTVAKLNQIIHPELIRQLKAKLARIKKGIVVLDAPLLLEAGLRNLVDRLIVVAIEKDELLRRIKQKRALKIEDILKRLKFQLPLSVKKRLADFIIDNNGSLKKTALQVKKIIAKIQGGESGKVGY